MNIRKITLGSISVVATAGVVSATFAFAPLLGSRDHNISFNGRIFSNEEEALAYLVKNRDAKNPIFSSQKVLGNLEHSYANYNTKELRKEGLPNYDPSSIGFAYRNAGGGLANYNDAKRTYYNPGTVVKKYNDGFGQNFLSEGGAARSNRQHSFDTKIGFYNVGYLRNNAKGDLTTKSKKMNPFNSKDVNDYKQNIKEHIWDIIKENLSSSSSHAYDINNFHQQEQNGYSGTTAFTKEFNVYDLLKNMYRENSSLIFNDSAKTISRVSAIKTLYNRVSSNWKEIGDWQWNDQWVSSWDLSIFRVANYGKRWTWYPHNNWRNPQSVVNMFSNPNHNWVHTTPISLSNLHFTEFQNYSVNELSSTIDNKMRDSNLLKNLFPNSPILNNSPIKSLIWNKYENQIKSKIKSKIEDAASSKSEILFTEFPDFSIDARDSGVFGVDNDVKIIDKTYEFKYKIRHTMNISKENITLNNLVAQGLLNWKSGDFGFTISKNGRDLFDVTMKLEGKDIVVKSIEVSSTNHNNSALILDEASKNDEDRFEDVKNLLQKNSNAMTLVDNKQISSYLYWILNEFKNALKGVDKGHKTIIDVFDDYFGDADHFYGRAKRYSKFRYDADFDQNYPVNHVSIEPQEIVKMYIGTISNAYDKYHGHNSELLKQIAPLISDFSNVLLLNLATDHSAIQPLTLGRYNVSSISDFNAPVSSGDKSTPFGLATSFNEWNNLKVKTTFVPSLVLIAYDNNGNPINTGDYKYDDETLLEYNARHNVEPLRDFNYVFVNGRAQPVENRVTTIYKVSYLGEEHWFVSFEDAKRYMLKYIREHSNEI